MDDDWRSGITVDPKVLVGKPVIIEELPAVEDGRHNSRFKIRN